MLVNGGVHLVCAANVLLISVRTEDTRLIKRAFMLTSSRWPPKPGSDAEFVQPTVLASQWYPASCVLQCVPEKAGMCGVLVAAQNSYRRSLGR
jgi:hypothetical protein